MNLFINYVIPEPGYPPPSPSWIVIICLTWDPLVSPWRNLCMAPKRGRIENAQKHKELCRKVSSINKNRNKKKIIKIHDRETRLQNKTAQESTLGNFECPCGENFQNKQGIGRHQKSCKVYLNQTSSNNDNNNLTATRQQILGNSLVRYIRPIKKK